MTTIPLHRRLAEANHDLFVECANGPFITSLADGSLLPSVFREYLEQDSLFLRDFLVATAEAVKSCAAYPELVDGLARLLIGGVSELASVERDAAAMGVDIARISRKPATTAFARFLSSGAASGVPEVAVAILTPCLELYSYIGRSALESGRVTAQEPAYKNWFTKYAAPEMQELTRTWQAHVDSFSKDTPEVRTVYRTALMHERDFFCEFLR